MRLNKKVKNRSSIVIRGHPGIEPGTSRKYAWVGTLSENHTTRPAALDGSLLRDIVEFQVMADRCGWTMHVLLAVGLLSLAIRSRGA